MADVPSELMKAMAMNSFGGPETLQPQMLPKPTAHDNQVLIRVAYAGIGPWDIFEREGLFAQMYPGEPLFPYVLGSEGAGEIVSLGKDVQNFRVGDLVYGLITARSPKAGFYAEYAAVDAASAWPIPRSLTIHTFRPSPHHSLS